MAAEFAIRTLGLTKEFDGLVAVDGLELAVRQGELFSLLGPNGAGKTTTINMLCCLLPPTRGTAEVLGYDIARQPFEVKSRIGVSPQETALSERLTARENLAFMGRLYGLHGPSLEGRISELLGKMGLLERSREPVSRFSGGMKRRLNLLMALVHDPPLLFLDEPTLGMDPQARHVLWEYIQELKGKKTILLTTHYMEEAEALSDRVGIIDHGRLVALGSPQELKERYGAASLEEVFLKLTGRELRE